MMPRSPKLLATLAILAAVVLWGGSYVSIKAVLAQVTPLDLVAVRLLLAVPTLAILLKFSRQKLIPRQGWILMGITAVVLFFHFFIMSEGMKETTASHSAWILTVAPLVTVLLAWLWLREQPTWRHWVGMLIASAGVILLDNTPAVLSSGTVTSKGNLLVLATCGTWAVYTILMKRLTTFVSPLIGTFWITSIAAVIFVPVALSQGMISHTEGWSVGVLWHLVYLGVGCLALAFWFWSEGLRLYSTAESSVYLYIEPLITVFFAWMLLGEHPTGWLWIGAMAIAIGVHLAESKPKRKSA